LSERHSLIAAWILSAVALFLVLRLHLLPALLAGLLVHELVHVLAPRLPKRFFNRRAKPAAVALIVVASVIAVAALVIGAVAFFRSEAGSLANLLTRMAQIIDDARRSLPPWVIDHLPDDADAINRAISDWLRTHASEVGSIGKEAGLALAHVLVGLIIGALISLHELRAGEQYAPLARALTERAARLADAFRRIVFAQVKISAINAAFTALYLAVALPLFGVHLPLTKTMIAVTFVAGLLPIIGNLISNTVIVVVSLAHSPQVAAASLAFLVTVHKLEYFLNARIVGSQIDARAWELLSAMLIMDAAFGLPGVVAAPVFYAYLKDELRTAGLV
jgi:predicted PurR-regulated permease PerM